ncbi:MAG: hypothetical protein R3300_07860, partial [Candidatus Promineifilaceae bacterium]|nr:hypothetical protein [Candidatus Promineifilaceae bacterium]
MAKAHTQFICQRCGRITAAYVGKCPQCGEFGTMVEQIVSATSQPRRRERLPADDGLTRSEPQRLSEVNGAGAARLKLPMDEFARVLGGGVVPGSIILVGGEPG